MEYLADTLYLQHGLSSYPSEAPLCQAQLPEPFQFTWTGGENGIQSIVAQFRERAAAFEVNVNLMLFMDVHRSLTVRLSTKKQDVWTVLTEIDDQLWVLAPQNQLLRSVQCKFPLGNGRCHRSLKSLSLQYDDTSDRGAPESIPVCKLQLEW